MPPLTVLRSLGVNGSNAGSAGKGVRVRECVEDGLIMSKPPLVISMPAW